MLALRLAIGSTASPGVIKLTSEESGRQSRCSGYNLAPSLHGSSHRSRVALPIRHQHLNSPYRTVKPK